MYIKTGDEVPFCSAMYDVIANFPHSGVVCLCGREEAFCCGGLSSEEIPKKIKRDLLNEPKQWQITCVSQIGCSITITEPCLQGCENP